MLISGLLTGCAGAGTVERSQPGWFEDREPLPTCTDVELDQGEALSEAASACLIDGSTDVGAELLVRSPTTEGDLINTYYRRLPDSSGLDVVTDATRDQFGVDGWQWLTCPDATSPKNLGECAVRATEAR